MTVPTHAADPETHAVTNQASPLVGHNAYLGDRALAEAVAREGGAWIHDSAVAFGERCASTAIQRAAELAERVPPVLVTHDRFGHRVDVVEYHPAYHELMALGLEAGLAALPWTASCAGAHVARAALFIPYMQTNEGPACPITMTFASLPAIRSTPQIAAMWEPKILAPAYDSANVPSAAKRAVTIGMAMTEKQGGSDVRANTSRATALGNGGSGGAYAIVGHKWFCSAPMCDAFLVLAQAPSGLSCFLVPRWRPDGSRNAMHLQRLKPKLGNRSNASSEVEFRGAFGWLLGEEGRGVPTIIEMVRHTRLDCALGSAGNMRHAVAQAIHHCDGRSAFGRRLVEQPLMQNVLADLALESEAATMLAVRVARAFDEAGASERQARLVRVLTPVAKYWICKRAPMLAGEALECLGGNGYVEESPMPRIYRDAPVNSVWEGSGNVQCLDLLRALARDPATLQALYEEIEDVRRGDARLDRFVAAVQQETSDLANLETRARRIVERLALAVQGALMVRHAPPAVAEAFLATRIGGERGLAFGTMPATVDSASIIDRARPAAR